MGNITLEQIDLIMQRTHVSYSEAKEALEQANGDILEALLLLERKEKAPKKDNHSTTEKVTSFVDNLNNTTFIMEKGGRTYIDVPLSIAIITFILCFHVSLIALVISLIIGIKIQVKGENEIARKIKSTFDDFTK
ncbi:DUF4342 domain-containing protein [Cellulosilyticum lentocellum]|uniref:Ubiquitin-associated-domain-containing protein n=1 Tax=Cellulosilyticum lentocellum (strain ATCC 49066 / DSM 5427 / NCIMB 11756 / RHM5) TaxID=642492 RepID=F2JSK2_CELLD|nr:DUF4342 domain-containing protein [Cellulosilyticum lentocellum]ADZ81782.1 ubiquitin-associated- domain-containing protein [Cellulosilyticum lentocellum DSM 5427]